MPSLCLIFKRCPSPPAQSCSPLTRQPIFISFSHALPFRVNAELSPLRWRCAYLSDSLRVVRVESPDPGVEESLYVFGAIRLWLWLLGY